MKLSFVVICLLGVATSTGCTAAKIAKNPINKMESKVSNNYHAMSYSKTLASHAPRLIGTWTAMQTYSLGKTYVDVYDSTLSLFSDGTFVSRSHHYTTHAILLGPYEPWSNGDGTVTMRTRPSTGANNGKFGVNTGKGIVTSGEGAWRKIGPSTIELTDSNGENPREIDLSVWTSQHAAYHDWLESPVK